MAEERTLTAVIRPKLDLSELQQVLSQGLNLNLNTSGGQSAPGGGATDTNNTENRVEEEASQREEVKQEVTKARSTLEIIKDVISGRVDSQDDRGGGDGGGILPRRLQNRSEKKSDDAEKGDDSENQQRNRTLQRIQAGLAVTTATVGTLLTLGRSATGFLESMLNQLKQASPLLQAVESLFNLAVQMFLMPLGNKIGEQLIPATIDLLDQVMEIWDAFDNMTIGEAVEYAIEQGTRIFGDYLINIGDTLAEETGVVGSIGEFLQELGSFIKEDGEALLNVVFDFAGFFMRNWEHFISLYVGFQTAQLGATIGGAFGPVGAAVGTLLGGGAGFLGTELILAGVESNGDGTYVPPTTGGALRIVSERGEGEYIIPESKMDQMGGGITINNNFYGYNESELIEKVNDTVNTAVSRSRISGAL